jgi:hypothetical protein
LRPSGPPSGGRASLRFAQTVKKALADGAALRPIPLNIVPAAVIRAHAREAGFRVLKHIVNPCDGGF